MTVLTIIVVYLLIGAIIGLKEHKIVENVIKDMESEVTTNLIKTWKALCVIITIVLSPIVTLWLVIRRPKIKIKK